VTMFRTALGTSPGRYMAERLPDKRTSTAADLKDAGYTEAVSGE